MRILDLCTTLVPYHARRFPNDQKPICSARLSAHGFFCTDYIHTNLLNGEICVTNYFTSRLSMNDDHEFMTTLI